MARIGYLPEERGLYKKMKVADEIVYLARLKGMSTSRCLKARCCQWLERFGLTEWRDKKLEALSKGMQQKVQFIATVLHEPRLLIFDEPFSGFDPVNAEQLKQEILHLQQEGATILFSTHNMESVEEVCQRITLINHSRVVLEGDVDDIRQQHKQNIIAVRPGDGQLQPPTSALHHLPPALEARTAATPQARRERARCHCLAQRPLPPDGLPRDIAVDARHFCKHR